MPKLFPFPSLFNKSKSRDARYFKMGDFLTIRNITNVPLYLSQHAYVTLYSSSTLHAWMRELPDSTPLGALSIPGTHNSPACHRAPPSVRCQAVSPRQQLENGVRFFDIRVQVPVPYNANSDKLFLVHSVFPISLSGPKYFRDLYQDIRAFLDANPSETLIVSLKREGAG